MANTITNLLPDLYEALDVVSRELVGFIPAVSRDSSVERAAVGQTVRSFVAPAATAADITPGQLPADNGDQTLTNKTMTISKQRYCPIRWNGEQQMGIQSGVGYSNVRAAQMAQAFRTLTNEMEADLASLYTKASRAVQPAGTTLFDAANYKDIANVRKTIVDNGCPLFDMHVILNTLSGAALRGNAQYAGADTAGREDIVRQGVLLDVHGMAIRESAQVAEHTAGTGSGLKTDSSGYAVGATEITVATDGSGTIVAGDVITFSSDASGAKYVVTTGGNMDSGGTVTIAEPGLLGSISAAQADIVIVDNAQRNMAFSRNAIHLATRAPALPEEGDMALDRELIVDPHSGLAFEISMYPEYRRVRYEAAIVWGYEVIKPEHLALLID
jgi:hypothetical protein